MTYSGCRFLGPENNWKGNKEGLSVDVTGITAAYLPYRSSTKDGLVISSDNIKLEQKTITGTIMKGTYENNDYLACTFKETDTSKYRVLVFDRNGDIIFKTSDKAGGSIHIAGNKIYFYNTTTGTICIGQIK